MPGTEHCWPGGRQHCETIVVTERGSRWFPSAAKPLGKRLPLSFLPGHLTTSKPNPFPPEFCKLRFDSEPGKSRPESRAICLTRPPPSPCNPYTAPFLSHIAPNPQPRPDPYPNHPSYIATPLPLTLPAAHPTHLLTHSSTPLTPAEQASTANHSLCSRPQTSQDRRTR